MNRTRNTKIIKVKRTRNVRKNPKPIQPRLRLVTIRKRKYSNEDAMGSMKKRVRLSEKRSSTLLILPYCDDDFSEDKHTLFFKKKKTLLEENI
jgi:hypothetical protein